MAVMPVINARQAGLADGKRIRFLNLNGKLADAEGRLFDCMMNPDKLHPAVAGYQVWADRGIRRAMQRQRGNPLTWRDTL